MKILIDTGTKKLQVENETEVKELDLYSSEAFEIISTQWLKVGWNEKYVYTYSWLGRPIIQLPEDLMRIQEVIYQVKPDVIIETGIAHGGSLVFFASLCRILGKGRVIGIEIELREKNRNAIQNHELFPLITLIEGSSTSQKIIEQVNEQVQPGEAVLVFLDSNHSKEHVRAELEAYSSLVTSGSYIVATDGIMQELHDVPRGQIDWQWDNPAQAAREFAREHPEFILGPPEWPFNESHLKKDVTHWPGAWLRKL